MTAVDRDLQVYRHAVLGDHISFAGPGVDIVIGSGGRTRIMTGTSAAVPFVTAAIAADPALIGQSVDVIRSVLAARAVDLGADGPDPVFGLGLLLAPSGCGT